MEILSKAFNIQPFQVEYQAGARDLILAGLAEHWGWLDPGRNPDLDDIGSAYADAFFLVAVQQGRVIGTGALIPKADSTAEIVRMSVAADIRRRGVASAILQALYGQAHMLGMHQLVLETTETWQDAIAFYEHFGFKETHRLYGNIHFKLYM
jgi:GNAT superfamily N-acetyltransferase